MPAVACGAAARRLALPALVVSVGLAACGPHPDLAQDRAALLRLHEVQRQAHLARRADLLVATFADTFYSVASGEVDTPSHAASMKRFQAYFDRSTFLAWDDRVPPIIRISPDGQMAYVIVRKEVRVTQPDGAGVPRAIHTTYAWLETYEKNQGVWRLHAIASTDHPNPPHPPTED